MKRPYPKFNRRHVGVMHWLLTHPAATLTECAKEMEYSRSWLSRIVNAPEFKSEYRNQLDIELFKVVRTKLRGQS